MYTIYTKHDCPWCIKAKAVLENLGHPYEEKHYNVDFDKDDLIAMLPEDVKATVPQIFLDNDRIGGYNDLCSRLGLDVI
jgi:glutaredoxin